MRVSEEFAYGGLARARFADGEGRLCRGARLTREKRRWKADVHVRPVGSVEKPILSTSSTFGASSR